MLPRLTGKVRFLMYGARAAVLAPLMMLSAEGEAARQYVLDPLSRSMVQYCRGAPACVRLQKKGVVDYLTILRARRVSVNGNNFCIKKSVRKVAKQRFTDWAAAAKCVGTVKLR